MKTRFDISAKLNAFDYNVILPYKVKKTRKKECVTLQYSYRFDRLRTERIHKSKTRVTLNEDEQSNVVGFNTLTGEKGPKIQGRENVFIMQGNETY